MKRILTVLLCLLAVAALAAVIGGGAYYKYSKDTEDVKPPEIRLETESITLSVSEPETKLVMDKLTILPFVPSVSYTYQF